MNILITILIIIVALIVIMLVAALFIKKEYALEREIVVNKPKPEVFNYVRYLKNQDNFSKWVMTDPSMKKDFMGIDGTPGFIYAWDSKRKDAGKGEQQIKKIVENERIDVEVRFEKPFKGLAQTPFITEAISQNQTKVRWGMKGRSQYPMNLMNLFMGKMLGKDIEVSLRNLKAILENN